jgi:segregation and condensation protein B
VAEAWQVVSLPEYAPWIKTLVGQKNRPARLSQPALETLAIIAYRQPVTRAEVEEVRGVAVDGVMQTLLERGLVEQVGRAEAAGRPVTYGTTALFLEYFGLKNLDGLPAGDELRRIVVKKPEVLLTAEPGSAEPVPAESGSSTGTEASAPAAPGETTAEQPAAPADETEPEAAEDKNPS